MGKGWKRGKKLLAAVLTLWLCTEPGVLFRAQTCGRTAQAEENGDFDLYAKSAILMDGGSGRVLYDRDGEIQLAMASTTKIMTCILALELADEKTVCIASQNAAAQPKVKLGMTEGEQFYLGDLLYSLMLESHNDTAVCIAETVGGSVEGFAEQMNRKAAEIGCTQTHYVTPNGLDAEDGGGTHHTTARDLALVMRYCITQSPKAQEFLKITQTASYDFTSLSGHSSYSCSNHNALLDFYDGAVSGKTGFTGEAGYCYIGAAERDGELLIVSLLACGWPNNKGYKWVDAKKLLNYGFSEYELRDITKAPDAVSDGEQEETRQYDTEQSAQGGSLSDSIQSESDILAKDGEKTDSEPDAILKKRQAEETQNREQTEQQPEYFLWVEDGQSKQVGAVAENPGSVYVLMRPDETVQTEITLAESLSAPVEKGQRAGSISWLVDGTIYACADIKTLSFVPERTFLSCLYDVLALFLIR